MALGLGRRTMAAITANTMTAAIAIRIVRLLLSRSATVGVGCSSPPMQHDYILQGLNETRDTPKRARSQSLNLVF